MNNNMSTLWFINCCKGTTPVQDVNNGGNWGGEEAGEGMWELSAPSTPFYVNLKLL